VASVINAACGQAGCDCWEVLRPVIEAERKGVDGVTGPKEVGFRSGASVFEATVRLNSASSGCELAFCETVTMTVFVLSCADRNPTLRKKMSCTRQRRIGVLYAN
jgi:hypothetical protein